MLVLYTQQRVQPFVVLKKVMKKIKPYCPYNGSHGMRISVVIPNPIGNCLHCNYDKMMSYDNYCPTCKFCNSCHRIIKNSCKDC
jgi:hypothetical protein